METVNRKHEAVTAAENQLRTKYKVPEGLTSLLEDMSRQVILNNPPDIYTFLANYLESLLPEHMRCGKSPCFSNDQDLQVMQSFLQERLDSQLSHRQKQYSNGGPAGPKEGTMATGCQDDQIPEQATVRGMVSGPGTDQRNSQQNQQIPAPDAQKYEQIQKQSAAAPVMTSAPEQGRFSETSGQHPEVNTMEEVRAGDFHVDNGAEFSGVGKTEPMVTTPDAQKYEQIQRQSAAPVGTNAPEAQSRFSETTGQNPAANSTDGGRADNGAKFSDAQKTEPMATAPEAQKYEQIQKQSAAPVVSNAPEQGRFSETSGQNPAANTMGEGRAGDFHADNGAEFAGVQKTEPMATTQEAQKYEQIQRQSAAPVVTNAPVTQGRFSEISGQNPAADTMGEGRVGDSRVDNGGEFSGAQKTAPEAQKYEVPNQRQGDASQGAAAAGVTRNPEADRRIPDTQQQPSQVARNADGGHAHAPFLAQAEDGTGFAGAVREFVLNRVESMRQVLSSEVPLTEARNHILTLAVSCFVGLVLGYALARSLGIIGDGSRRHSSGPGYLRSPMADRLQIVDVFAKDFGQCPK